MVQKRAQLLLLLGLRTNCCDHGLENEVHESKSDISCNRRKKEKKTKPKPQRMPQKVGHTGGHVLF